MYYQKFKRRENPSICNICLKSKTLSWDHVPPKGGVDIGSVEQETILQKFTTPITDKKSTFSQNGVKFRTICSECNNSLGGNYDLELNRFSLGVKEIIESKLILPPIIYIKAKPNKILKSLYGHFLAAKVDIENTTIDESLRAYYFNETKGIKVNLNMFYWVYPYQNFVVIRDVLMPAVRGNLKQVGYFSILKYYPIAFLLTDLDQYYDLRKFTIYKSENIDEEINIPIYLEIIKDPDWPESVEDGNMLFGGQSINSSVYAISRKNKH
jgi:hypothetical protein